MEAKKERVCQMTTAVIAIFMLMSGGYIYIVYRDTSLLMFHWADSLRLETSVQVIRGWGQVWEVDEWIKFCLPDGLWVASYMMLMWLIWQKTTTGYRMTWILILPIIALLAELLQGIGILIGTFDIGDIISYAIPISIYLFYEYHYKKTFKNKNIRCN